MAGDLDVSSLLRGVVLCGLVSANLACDWGTPLAPSEVDLDSTICLKPLALPDKWAENSPMTQPWSVSSTFDRYVGVGRDPFEILDHPDVYMSPDKRLRTGYSIVDHGRSLTLTPGPPGGATGGTLKALSLRGLGASTFRDDLLQCNGLPVAVGDDLTLLAGNATGLTVQGLSELLARDPAATWDSATNAVRNTCAPACGPVSPRVIVLPLFDPDAYQRALARGDGSSLHVVKLVQVFIAAVSGTTISAHLIIPSS